MSVRITDLAQAEAYVASVGLDVAALAVIVAEALPWPRASLACARIATVWLASSACWIRTVPLYWAVIGPILSFIVPL